MAKRPKRGRQSEPGAFFSNEPSPEALAYFRNKADQPSFNWQDVWASEHAHAFTVAKATNLDVLQAIRQSVDDALANGVPYEEFAKGLAPRLQKLGWWGRQAVIDPETGEEIMAELGTPRRLRLIYDANIRSAHAAGQWARAQRTKDFLPYLIYVETTSAEPRDEHLAQVNTIAHIDDPYWDVWFPPNGWECKCGVRQITEAEAISLGFKPGSRPLAVPTRQWLNKRTGEIEEIPVGIDPGWHTNPAKHRAATLDTLLGGALDAASPAVRSAALKDLGESWLLKKLVSGEVTGASAPIGHLGKDVAASHRSKSGVVWLSIEKQLINPWEDVAVADWARLPHIIDRGAIVQHETTPGWLAIYHKIDGRYYKAEVFKRDRDINGDRIPQGRLNLERFSPIDAETVKLEIRVAKSEGRLVRSEATPGADVGPAPTGPARRGRKRVKEDGDDETRGLPKQGRGDGKPRLKPVAFAEAKRVVLDGGKKTDSEWGYAYDGSGRHLATWTESDKSSLGIEPKLLPELWAPGSAVSLHHNHPRSTSFSREDLTVFSQLPGLETLVAHGHDGSMYRVAVGDREGLSEAVELVAVSATRRLRALAAARPIPAEEINEIAPHIRALALHRLGTIKYEAKLGSKMRPIWGANQPTYEAIVEAIAREFESLDDR